MPLIEFTSANTPIFDYAYAIGVIGAIGKNFVLLSPIYGQLITRS